MTKLEYDMKRIWWEGITSGVFIGFVIGALSAIVLIFNNPQWIL